MAIDPRYRLSKRLLSPQMQGRLVHERALAEKAKNNPEFAKFLAQRQAAYEKGLQILIEAGFHVEVAGGHDEASIVKITATELEVGVDLKTTIGPDKQVVSAEYSECSPRIVIQGLDIGAYCTGFMLICNTNANDPLTIIPTLKGSRGYALPKE